MARDIEEFLKQAAQRRQQKLRQRQQQGQQQPAQPRPVQPQPPRQRPPQQQQFRPPEEIHIIEAEEIQPTRTPLVDRHVETHIDTRRIAQHAEQLGDRIESVDSRVDARIHRKFDHRVGHLQAGELVSDDQSMVDQSDEIPPLARDLFEAFRSPQSVRQAILLTEVLNRPNFDESSRD